MSSDKKNGPVKRYRAGQVAAAIFEEEVEFDGQRTTRASVTFQKRYQDRKTKEWKSSTSFFARDLGDLKLVVDRAHQYVVLREDESRADGESF